MDTGSLNFAWFQALVGGFAGAGVRHAVISPGSRSTPLALALLRQPGMDCRIIIDERSAAFFALGIAKATGRPVLILATSGSAPANWLPAVVEASQAAIPLLLLSADRPPELHGCGANQTVDQVKLFGSHVRACHALGAPDAGFDPGYLHRLAARAAEQAAWPLPGPVHLNLPCREPLLPPGGTPLPPAVPAIPVEHPRPLPPGEAIARLAASLSGRPGAIVCGEADYPEGFSDAVATLAARLACPVLAEPLSNLRFGPHDRSHILCRYDGWLRNPAFVAGHRPEWLLRFGAFPVGRSLQGFVATASRTTALVDPLPRWNDPSHRVTDLLRADPLATCEALLEEPLAAAPGQWMEDFRQADSAAAHTGEDDATFEGQLLPALLAVLPENCPVFVGNSMLIRDLDAFSGKGARPIRFHGNRGASGIDGNVSTALGIAAARGRLVAFLGDLTCQHDLGGLAAARGLSAVVVVMNNGGGGIFDHLPQAALPEFEAGWLTPQAIDFAAAAAAFGLAYARADGRRDGVAALRTALETGGPHLLEVIIDRRDSLARHRDYWRRCMEAALLPAQG
ncbi:MAG: 2-succinyl-5-enolpyruvyl-6-hydroxy-3-cyclohexene-carboxylic-acid synthase [Rhodocyclaceae bacterium]|nr:2-succinyl-5-enolpyruvyl-6-hydroxy-3-cyclohexene-carboxylic-acid synthase [Rhodocyclaceae bacterium]